MSDNLKPTAEEERLVDVIVEQRDLLAVVDEENGRLREELAELKQRCQVAEARVKELEAALAAEREACARLADRQVEDDLNWAFGGPHPRHESAADAIRARGKGGAS